MPGWFLLLHDLALILCYHLIVSAPKVEKKRGDECDTPGDHRRA